MKRFGTLFWSFNCLLWTRKIIPTETVAEGMQNNILRNSKLSKQGYRQKKLFKIFSHLCQRRPKSWQKIIYHKTPRISAGVLNFLQFLATQITVSYFASLYIYTGITSLLNYITHYNVLAYFSKYFKQNSLNSFMTEIHII